MSYELDSAEVLKKLKVKKIQYLYHANTVRTSCTFLREGALLSRGTLDEKGLDQTEQYTDEVDKKFGIWYDIFLDTNDLNKQLGRANKYGPVLFQFDVNILNEEWLPYVWITKSNPAGWEKNNISYEERYFTEKEFKEEYNPISSNSYKNHIVLRNIGGVLRLKPYLEVLKIDDPEKNWPKEKKDNIKLDVFSLAMGAIINATRYSSSFVREEGIYEFRKCKAIYKYKTDEYIEEKFSP